MNVNFERGDEVTVDDDRGWVVQHEGNIVVVRIDGLDVECHPELVKKVDIGH